jgi:hypothetical protein
VSVRDDAAFLMLKRSRLEIDPDGEVRLTEPEPRRRFLPRLRRRDPTRWGPQELQEHIRACYVGQARERADADHAAVVLYVPERSIPRRILRDARDQHGTWFEYQVWCLGWIEESWAAVLMGDDPIDLIRDVGGFDTEEDARAAARSFAGRKVRDVTYFSRPESEFPLHLAAFCRLPPLLS